MQKKKTREWQVRLLEDLKEHHNGKFITLTFSTESLNKLVQCIKEKHDTTPEGYDLDNAIATQAVRYWLERWRKKYKKSLRHWLVTELGQNNTEHVHIHGIIWTDIELQAVKDTWQYGFVYLGKLIKGTKKTPDKYINYVNEETVNYITKYVSKIDLIHQKYKPVILTSAGIGRCYMKNSNHKLNKYNGTDTREFYRTSTGHKISMPIYWRNKIYSDTEREQLWLHKLDKNERWVLGNRIDVSNGQQEYFNALVHAQTTNRNLGYGGNEIKDWNRAKYEQERRKLVQQQRGLPSARSIQKGLDIKP